MNYKSSYDSTDPSMSHEIVHSMSFQPVVRTHHRKRRTDQDDAKTCGVYGEARGYHGVRDYRSSRGHSLRGLQRPWESWRGFGLYDKPSSGLCPIGTDGLSSQQSGGHPEEQYPQNHCHTCAPITDSQFARELPSHHRFPSRSIRPHSLSHCFRVRLLSLANGP